MKSISTKSSCAGLILALAFAPVATTSFAQPAASPPAAKPAPRAPASTPAERKACFPDVEKFCEEKIAEDPSVILACLKSHLEELSPECRTVLDKRDR